MYLTKKEEGVLEGEEGEGRRLAMELLVAIGEAFDAERLIPITRAHVATSAQEGDTYWAERLAEGGARVVVRTTTNPPWDYDFFSKFVDFTEYEVSLLHRTVQAYRKLGTVLSFSCTPYIDGNVPYFGEAVAFSESSATPFVNSVIGARTNREGSPSALAAAVIGKTPLYGLHLDGNRRANLLVRVETDLEDEFDFGLLGIHVGAIARSGIPAFEGIREPTREDMVYLSAELATSGAVPMFHILGWTPEARILGDGVLEEGLEVVEVGKEDLEDTLEKWSEGEGEVESVLLGCPHYTYEQLVEVARFAEGRRVRSGIPVYILTSRVAMEAARASGILGKLEAAGISVVPDTCIDQPSFKQIEGTLGCTDSFKNAYYRTRRGQRFIIAPWRSCLRRVMSG